MPSMFFDIFRYHTRHHMSRRCRCRHLLDIFLPFDAAFSPDDAAGMLSDTL